MLFSQCGPSIREYGARRIRKWRTREPRKTGLVVYWDNNFCLHAHILVWTVCRLACVWRHLLWTSIPCNTSYIVRRLHSGMDRILFLGACHHVFPKLLADPKLHERVATKACDILWADLFLCSGVLCGDVSSSKHGQQSLPDPFRAHLAGLECSARGGAHGPRATTID